MIAIIDYRAGNLKSVERALNKLGYSCRITNNKDEILDAERIVFPGVGAAGKAIDDLRRMGLDRVLSQAFLDEKPILGICLGAQVILDRSEENNTRCLGLIRGEVKRFPSPIPTHKDEQLKIPQMGWNGVRILKDHPVLMGVMPGDEFYFVHSYYTLPAFENCLIGMTEYGVEFPSIIGTRNLIATQFHLEKSGRAGLRILRNFCNWDGKYVE